MEIHIHRQNLNLLLTGGPVTLVDSSVDSSGHLSISQLIRCGVDVVTQRFLCVVFLSAATLSGALTLTRQEIERQQVVFSRFTHRAAADIGATPLKDNRAEDFFS